MIGLPLKLPLPVCSWGQRGGERLSERAHQAQRLSVDPEVEQLRLQVRRALESLSERAPCRTFPVPARLLALRTVHKIQRWLVIVKEPEWLRGLATVRRRLLEFPEVLNCRIERIDGHSVHVALMTTGLEREVVRALIERRLRESGCPAPFELVARGKVAQDDADLR